MRPALIFDLDDTLYPEAEYIRSGFRAVAEDLETRLGLSADATFAELEHLFWQEPAAGVFDRWLENRGLTSAELLDLMIQTYRLNQPPLRLFCDARWALDRYRTGFRLALLTDGRSLSQRHKIKALGIESAFEAVVVTDELSIASRKPSTRGFEWLLEQLGTIPRTALYVGDNPLKDFFGAKRLGMATVRVRRRCGIHRQAEAPGPDYAPDAEISSLFELPEVLPFRP